MKFFTITLGLLSISVFASDYNAIVTKEHSKYEADPLKFHWVYSKKVEDKWSHHNVGVTAVLNEPCLESKVGSEEIYAKSKKSHTFHSSDYFVHYAKCIQHFN